MLLQYAEALLAKRLVLASASPRRREILGNLGLKFDVVVSNFDEDLDKARFTGGADYAKATATQKAIEVATRLEKDERVPFMIIGADTVVEAPDGSIMEKPKKVENFELHVDEHYAKDADEAMKMLLSLQGITHQVHTGVGVVFPAVPDPERQGERLVKSFSETTKVTFASLEEAEMLAYIKTGEPFDKAGGYGIQGPAGAFVSSLTGCYFNVMGFPIHKFASTISDMIKDGSIKM